MEVIGTVTDSNTQLFVSKEGYFFFFLSILSALASHAMWRFRDGDEGCWEWIYLGMLAGLLVLEVPGEPANTPAGHVVQRMRVVENMPVTQDVLHNTKLSACTCYAHLMQIYVDITGIHTTRLYIAVTYRHMNIMYTLGFPGFHKWGYPNSWMVYQGNSY